MDENRVAGTVKNTGGKAQEGFGRVVGDARIRLKVSPIRSKEARRTCMAKRAIAHPSSQMMRRWRAVVRRRH